MSSTARAWEHLLTVMEDRIGHQDVEVWLRGARPRALSDSKLVVEVDNAYYADWIRDNYLKDLKQEVRQQFGPNIELQFVLSQSEEHKSSQPKPKAPTGPRATGVNRRQTFESFVVGECNKFAHAAACAVADHPADNYNPLFIYGNTGLGKTHLMHAIANQVLQRDPSARIVYVTAEAFMNEMISSLRYKRMGMEDFRAKYRQRATVLLVDDIQTLAGRDRTQEEFFHTFNALQTSGRQIVLTSDVVPKDIDKLEPRLRTRFEGGLLADMQAPDKETLIAILAQKAENQGIFIPPKLAEAIAGTVAGNIRELEGVLNRLSAAHNFYNEPLSLEFAQRRLPQLFDQQPTQVTPAAIIEAVARYHQIRSADITGSSRTRLLTRPRQIAMFLSRRHTEHSFPELGREFGNRDHSTVQFGVRKIDKMIKSDSELAYKVRLIEQSLHL